MRRSIVLALLACGLASTGHAGPFTSGTPEYGSLGALSFGPDNVLFIGDSQKGQILALQVADEASSGEALEVRDIDEKIAAMIGTHARDVQIKDMAVNPVSGNAYLTVARGNTDILLKVTPGGVIEHVALANVNYATKSLASVVAEDKKDRRGRSLRREAITDLVFTNGELYVAGLSNEEFSSTLRIVAYPFDASEQATSVEIFHAAHNRYETHAPIRTLMAYDLAQVPHVLAAYTCTPLVTFPVEELIDGAHVKGKTVAELGSGNRPLDMISYDRDGKDFILLANSNRTLMKIDPADIEAMKEGITTPVEGRYETAGVEYISIAQVGVQQIDNLNDEHVLVLQRMGNGSLDLRSLQKRRL